MNNSFVTPSFANTRTTHASAFLQANEANFRELVTFVDFAPEKFTIGFVSVNFSGDQATIIEALKQHPDCQEVQFVQYTFDDPKLRFLQDELIKELPKIEREPDKKLVLLLTGLEESIRMVGGLADYPPMLVDLNYVRDGFTTNVPYPMIIFLPDKSLNRLAEFAPDFWAWRRAVVRFESVPDAVKSKMYQAVQRGDSAWLSAGKGADYPALDARARRDMLPRLLMEYESGSLARDEDYQGFKSELMAELGISLYDDDSLDVAKDILWKSLESGDFEESTISRPKAYYYLGLIEKRQNSYERAVELLNQSIGKLEKLEESQYPNFKESLIGVIAQRGETYQLMECYLEAVADFTRAVELDPEYIRVIYLRGHTYQLMECYPEAVADYTRVIELDPEFKEVIALRGSIYRLMERYPEAVADYTRAIELNPNYERAITQRGYTYQLMERYPEAIADYTRAIELNSEYKDAIFFLRGNTYQLMKHYPEALADYTRAIELNPEYKDAITQSSEVRSLIGGHT